MFEIFNFWDEVEVLAHHPEATGRAANHKALYLTNHTRGPGDTQLIGFLAFSFNKTCPILDKFFKLLCDPAGCGDIRSFSGGLAIYYQKAVSAFFLRL